MTITVQCAECGLKFTTKRPNQQFCTPEHKTKFHFLAMKRGQVLMPLLLAKSAHRHAKTKADREAAATARRWVDALAAKWNQEDKAAGRDPRMLLAQKIKMCWSPADIT